MDVEKHLNDYRNLIENHLALLIPPTDARYKIVIDAARYSLLGGGKRLRPLLTLSTVETFGIPLENALSTACAIEIIHTYSLIHDDLPCMDDDDFRRGKPSLHKAYGEANAVLAGDLLLTKAFEIIATDAHLSPSKRIAIIELVSSKSGSNGLIGGQSLDMNTQNRPVTIASLNEIHRLKTGALITASLVAGAIIGDATTEQMRYISCFGDSLGLAFQIIDDILDVTAGEAKRGTPTSSDLINKKTTYVTLLGIEGASAAAESLLEEALAQLDELGHPSPMLSHLARCLVGHSIKQQRS